MDSFPCGMIGAAENMSEQLAMYNMQKQYAKQRDLPRILTLGTKNLRST